MKRILFSIILLFIITSSMSYVSANYFEVMSAPNVEMNGTIVDKDVAGISIDYLIEINGTKCWLSPQFQPYAEYDIGDNVTMNGTVINAKGYEHRFTCLDFDGKYEGQEMPKIRLHLISIDGKRGEWGQMRLTSDMNDPYYFNVGE